MGTLGQGASNEPSSNEQKGERAWSPSTARAPFVARFPTRRGRRDASDGIGRDQANVLVTYVPGSAAGGVDGVDDAPHGAGVLKGVGRHRGRSGPVVWGRPPAGQPSAAPAPRLWWGWRRGGLGGVEGASDATVAGE